MDEVSKNRLIKKDIVNAGRFFFLLIVLQIPLGTLVYTLQSYFSLDKEILVSIAATQGYLLIMALLFIAITGKKFNTDLEMKGYRPSSFFLSLLVLIAASPMAVLLNLLSQFCADNQVSVAIYELITSLPIGVCLFVVGAVPGFIEELLYRGIIYTSFRKYSILTGIIVSGLSFGLMHMNLNQIPYAIYLGIIFALVREATGSLLSSMIMHMIFNMVNTLYLYAIPMLNKLAASMGAGEEKSFEELANQKLTNGQLISYIKMFAPGAIIGVVITLLIINLIAQINGRSISFETICKKNYDTSDDVRVRPVTIGLIVGWIICIAVSIYDM